MFTTPKGNQRSGNFYLRNISGGDPIDGPHAIITEDNRAIYSLGGIKVFSPHSNTDIITSNNVTAGQTIGPIGTSLDGGSVESHLHLYAFEGNNFSIGDNNTKNPLDLVNHDSPFYEVTLFKPREINGQFEPNQTGIELRYPGYEETNLLLKAQASGAPNGNHYPDDAFNIEKVEFFIKNKDFANSSFQLIKGPVYESKIVYDGRIGMNNRYPFNLINRGDGDIGHTGMEPWAYSDNRQRPWDYFIFADFISRIHKSDVINDQNKLITDIPENSRYLDGNYVIEGQVTDINDNQFNSSGTSFILDNFQPFLTYIEINVIGDINFFSVTRKQFEGTNSPNDGFVVPVLRYNKFWPSEVTLKVSSSEPLKYLTGKYREKKLGEPNFGQWISLGSFSNNGNNPLEWRSGGISLSSLYCYEFEFKGQDKSGNNLINISAMTNNNIPYETASIPVRAGLSSWENIDSDYLGGADYIVYCPVESECIDSEPKKLPKREFLKSREPGGDCTDLTNLEAKVVKNCNNDSYEIILTNIDPEDYDIYWYDSKNDEWFDEINHILEVSETGTYCYFVRNFLDLFGNCCDITGCVTIPEEGFDVQIPIIYDIVDGLNENTKNLELLYNGDFTDLNYPITVELENTSGSQSFVSQILSPGTSLIPFVGLIAGQSYCLTYTDVNGCSVENCFEIEGNSCNDNYFTISGEITNATCNNNNGSIVISAIPSSSNGCQNFTYKWNDPLNSTSSTISNLPPGTYCVTVSFIDAQCLGCSSSQCFTVEETTGTDPIEVTAVTRINCVEEYNEITGNYTIKWFGFVDMTITGGTGNYTFNWNPQHINSSSNQNGGVNSYRFQFDQNGLYCVEITDECGNIYQNCFDDAPIVRKSTDGISLEAAEKFACLSVDGPRAEGFYRTFGFSDPKFNMIDLMSQLAQRNYPASLAYSPDLVFVKAHFNVDSVSYNMLVDNLFIMGNVGMSLRSGLREVSSVENNNPEVIPEDNGLILQVYPNPFSDLLNISVFSKENIYGVLEVYDIMGQKIYSDNITVSKDNTISRSLPLNSISSGIYTISLLTDESYQNIKVVKVK